VALKVLEGRGEEVLRLVAEAHTLAEPTDERRRLHESASAPSRDGGR
jgi:hypothetical protein